MEPTQLASSFLWCKFTFPLFIPILFPVPASFLSTLPTPFSLFLSLSPVICSLVSHHLDFPDSLHVVSVFFCYLT